MRAKKVLSIGKFLTYILLLLSIVGIVGFCAVFTNGFTDEFKTFYVVNGETYLISDTNNFELLADKENRFEVKYTFGITNNNAKQGYSVKIIPSVTDETNFNFTVDGENHTFADEQDLTAAFDIKLYENYFTLYLPSEVTLQEVIQILYSDKTVVAPNNKFIEKKYCKLVVTSYNENLVLNIGLCFQSILFDIDKGGIVF